MVNSFSLKILISTAILAIAIACGSTKDSNNDSEPSESLNPNGNIFIISTKFGDMKVELYDETPLHRDNFKKLVADSFYDGTLFHRVIDGFMIQGGDPSSKTAKPGQSLGGGNIGYTIPAEFNANFIHKRGALAAARLGDGANPEKRSSGSQFYIVDGTKVDAKTLASMAKRKDAMKKRTIAPQVLNDSANVDLKNKFFRARQLRQNDSINYYGAILQAKIDSLYKGNQFKYSPEHIALYDSIGGTPALDMDYTVFGEVIEGLNIIDSIAIQKKDRGNRPFDDIKMTIKKL